MAQRNFAAGGLNQAGDNRLHWMYDKPDKQVQHEDYLLGKEIGKSDESEKAQHAIPAVSRRVVGSSMTKTLDDTQVDLARKLREDPLLLVKERERAARAALLNNPLQRKRLAELLRKEKEQKDSKEERKTKKKSKKKDKNLDDILAAKLNALGEKKIDLSSLLNSNDSSSESQSSDEKSKKNKKRKKEKIKKQSTMSKKKKSVSDSEAQLSDDDNYARHEANSDNNRYQNIPKYQSYYSRNNESTSYNDRGTDFNDKSHKNIRNRDSNDDKYRKKCERSREKDSINRSNKYTSSESRKRRSDSYNESDGKTKQKKSTREYSDKSINTDVKHKLRDERERSTTFTSGKRAEGKERRQGMSEEDRAAKLAEMVAAGKERELERGKKVARQRAADAATPDPSRLPRALNNEARALPDSLESRIKSNRHYIQRDKMHMNQNFARR